MKRSGHIHGLLTGLWSSRCRLIAGIFLVLSLFLRFNQYQNPALWGDEVFQYSNIRGSFKPIHRQLSFDGDMTSFPGEYLLCYYFVQNFEPGSWGLRFPKIVIFIAFFAGFVWLCRKHLRSTLGWIVALSVITFNATLITHSFELRPYSVLPFWAVFSVLLCDALINRHGKRPVWQTGLILVFFFLCCTYHIYGLFIAYCPVLYFLTLQFLQSDFRTVLKRYAKLAAVFVLVTMPVWSWYALGNPFDWTKKADGGISTRISPFLYFPNPLENPAGFLKTCLGNLVGHKPLYVWLLGVFVFAFIPLSKSRRALLSLALLTVLPLGLVCLGSWVKGYYILQRQFIWVMPWFAMFLAQTWDLGYRKVTGTL